MTYLMLTYVSEDGARLYEAQSADDQAAGRDQHTEWFTTHAARIRGGHELAWPPVAGVVRAQHQPQVLDGPFVESKEILGGVIVLEADSLDQALEIAAGWPSLEIYPGARVDVMQTSSA